MPTRTLGKSNIRKYRRYAANIINSIVSPTARPATTKRVPRLTHASSTVII